MSPHGKPAVVWCSGRCFRLFLTLERKNDEQERLHLGSRPKSFGWLGTSSRSFNGRDRPMGLDRRHFCSHGLALREIIRAKEPIYESLDLGNPKWDDDAHIDCLLANPDSDQSAHCFNASRDSTVPTSRVGFRVAGLVVVKK
jgi:hypothetical protein